MNAPKTKIERACAETARVTPAIAAMLELAMHHQKIGDSFDDNRDSRADDQHNAAGQLRDYLMMAGNIDALDDLFGFLAMCTNFGRRLDNVGELHPDYLAMCRGMSRLAYEAIEVLERETGRKCPERIREHADPHCAELSRTSN